MEHITAWYWQKETVPGLLLALQHRKYPGRKASVVLACIADRRDLLMELQTVMLCLRISQSVQKIYI